MIFGKKTNLIQGQLSLVPSTLYSAMAPRVVGQNPSHYLGGNSEEMCLVLPVNLPVAYQLQKGFVH
jgi:hypothetical protein